MKSYLNSSSIKMQTFSHFVLLSRFFIPSRSEASRKMFWAEEPSQRRQKTASIELRLWDNECMKWAHKKVLEIMSFSGSRSFCISFRLERKVCGFCRWFFFHSSHSRNAVLKQIECVCRTGAFDKECNHFTSVIESLCECHDKSNFALQFDFKAKTVPVRHFALHVQTLFYFSSFFHRHFVEVFRGLTMTNAVFVLQSAWAQFRNLLAKSLFSFNWT